MNSDFKDLLQLFNANKVRYLVVGGYAVMKYTEPRSQRTSTFGSTLHRRMPEPFSKALRKFEAPLGDLTEEDFAREGFFYQIGSPSSPYRYPHVNPGCPIRRCVV